MLIDLHTHTFLSDGELGVAEHLRRAEKQGYDYIAVTDHIDYGNIEWVINCTIKECKSFNKNSSTKALAGVEITHVHPKEIEELVKIARDLGAKIVGVHGETIVEPVYEGTNHAAILADVDFLAHPGLIDEEDVKLASEKRIFLEVTSKRGHCLCNGRTVLLARKYNAPLIINSDAHSHTEFYSKELHKAVALGSGITEKEYDIIIANIKRFLEEKLIK